MHAIGLVEFNSIARGIEAADAMVKTAMVDLVIANPVCPGKYIVLVSGDVAAVQSAVKAGVKTAGQSVVDEFILPNVHPAVFPAITATSANRSGKNACLSGSEVERQLGKRIDGIIFSDRLRRSKGSTIIDCSSHDIKVILEGEIPFQKIKELESEER